MRWICFGRRGQADTYFANAHFVAPRKEARSSLASVMRQSPKGLATHQFPKTVCCKRYREKPSAGANHINSDVSHAPIDTPAEPRTVSLGQDHIDRPEDCAVSQGCKANGPPNSLGAPSNYHGDNEEKHTILLSNAVSIVWPTKC
jgi:hypothetical protein